MIFIVKPEKTVLHKPRDACRGGPKAENGHRRALVMTIITMEGMK